MLDHGTLGNNNCLASSPLNKSITTGLSFSEPSLFNFAILNWEFVVIKFVLFGLFKSAFISLILIVGFVIFLSFFLGFLGGGIRK